MDPLKEKLDSALREELKLNAISCALIIVGLRRGLNPYQQSDMWTPWGKVPESKEEQAFQDLVWFHKVLPPHDKFNSELAARGYYTKLKWKKLDEFWSGYDPEQDKDSQYRATCKPRSIHVQKQLKQPSSLKSIRKILAEGNYGF